MNRLCTMKSLRQRRATEIEITPAVGVIITLVERVGFTDGSLTPVANDTFFFITAQGVIVAPIDAKCGVPYQLYSQSDNLLYNVWDNSPDDCAVWIGPYSNASSSGTVIYLNMHNFASHNDRYGFSPVTYPGYFTLSKGYTRHVYLYGTENDLPYQADTFYAHIRVRCPSVYVDLTTVGFSTTDVVSFIDSAGTFVLAADIEIGVQYSLQTNATINQSTSISRFLQYNTPAWVGGWVGAYNASTNATGTKSGFIGAYAVWTAPFTFTGTQIDFYLYGLEYGDKVPHLPATQYAKISIHV